MSYAAMTSYRNISPSLNFQDAAILKKAEAVAGVCTADGAAAVLSVLQAGIGNPLRRRQFFEPAFWVIRRGGSCDERLVSAPSQLAADCQARLSDARLGQELL